MSVHIHIYLENIHCLKARKHLNRCFTYYKYIYIPSHHNVSSEVDVYHFTLEKALSRWVKIFYFMPMNHWLISCKSESTAPESQWKVSLYGLSLRKMCICDSEKKHIRVRGQSTGISRTIWWIEPRLSISLVSWKQFSNPWYVLTSKHEIMTLVSVNQVLLKCNYEPSRKPEETEERRGLDTNMPSPYEQPGRVWRCRPITCRHAIVTCILPTNYYK